MSKESIRSLLEANGSFPDHEDVRANFDALFALARDRTETPQDLAEGFLQALDQWSQVDAVVDPALAQRLREWTLSQWTARPYDLCMALCRVLANVPSEEVIAFLKEQREQCGDADLQRALDGFIGELTDTGG